MEQTEIRSPHFPAIGINQCARECVGGRIYPALGKEEICRIYMPDLERKILASMRSKVSAIFFFFFLMRIYFDFAGIVAGSCLPFYILPKKLLKLNK